MTSQEPIHVVVAVRSLALRHLVRTTLESEPGLQVDGAAATPSKVLAILAEARPDLVVLEDDAPDASGTDLWARIREEHPAMPVVFLNGTAVPARGQVGQAGSSKVAALEHALVDAGDAGAQELLTLVRVLTGRACLQPVEEPPAALPTTSDAVEAREAESPFGVLAVGSSTGGPNALATLFEGFPADLPVPVVLVQHMPPKFTRQLADRLNAHSALQVTEGEPGDLLLPGRAYIAPGDYHMTLARRDRGVVLRMNQDAPRHSCRPAVDPLFESVVDVYGSSILAVILTGMGRDGVDGCAAVRRAGGRVLVQDEATSVVWGMPGEVARAGLPHGVHPIEDMAGIVSAALTSGRRKALARPAPQNGS